MYNIKKKNFVLLFYTYLIVFKNIYLHKMYKKHKLYFLNYVLNTLFNKSLIADKLQFLLLTVLERKVFSLQPS